VAIDGTEIDGSAGLQPGGASLDVEPASPDAHRAVLRGAGLRSRSRFHAFLRAD
jgi:hypothetical protein